MSSRTIVAAVVVSLVCLALVGFLVFQLLGPEMDRSSSSWEDEPAEKSGAPELEEFAADSSDDPLHVSQASEETVEDVEPFEIVETVETVETTEFDETGDNDPDIQGGVEIEVVDPAGNPISDVTVRVISTRTRRVVGTEDVDDEGRVSFPLVHGNYWAEVEDPAADVPVSRTRDGFAVEGQKIAEVRVVLGSLDKTISGLVRDRHGQGVEGIPVVVRPFRPKNGELVLMEETTSHGITDIEGNFVVENLSDGEYVVQTLKADGYGQERLRVLAPATDLQIVVYKQERLVITGSVTEKDTGEPIQDVIIASSLGGMIEKTTEDGTFTLETNWRDSPRAGVAITARKVGYIDGKKLLVAGDVERVDDVDAGTSHLDADVTFELQVLQEGAVVWGTLTDDEGNPVPRERVFLKSKSLDVSHSAVSSVLGAFRIKNVGVADDYRVWIYPRNTFKDFKLEPVTVDEGDNELDIVLDQVGTGTLSGRLVTPDGSPVSLFRFRVRSMDSLANYRSARTDEAGGFRVEDVPTGALLLESHVLPKISVRGVELDTDEELDLDITLGFGDYSAEATVTSSDGEPVTGGRVVVTWIHHHEGLRSQLQNETALDADGRFSIPGFASGEVRVHVSVPGFHSRSTKVTLGEAASGDTRIYLKYK